MNTPDTPDPQAQAQILAHAYQAAVLSTLMKLLQGGKTLTFLDISKTPDTIDLPSHENEDRTRRLN